MHGNPESLLAFILFFPAFCVVGLLYCLFPTRPRGALRLSADLGVLILAALLSIFAMRWGFYATLGVGGAVWKQVAATLVAYAVFLGVLGIGWAVRALLFRPSGRQTSAGG